MGGNLDHMSKTERDAIEQFGETVKSRLGEYVITEIDNCLPWI
jgi:hypothetical protein